MKVEFDVYSYDGERCLFDWLWQIAVIPRSLYNGVVRTLGQTEHERELAAQAEARASREHSRAAMDEKLHIPDEASSTRAVNRVDGALREGDGKHEGYVGHDGPALRASGGSGQNSAAEEAYRDWCRTVDVAGIREAFYAGWQRATW